MALKGVVKRLTAPVEQLDREQLATFCDRLGVGPMDEVVARSDIRVGGEIRSVRLVPRAGAPAVEVTITDGRGSVTAVFLGRRKIAGIAPGRKMVIEGVAGRSGQRFLVFNPLYTLV